MASDVRYSVQVEVPINLEGSYAYVSHVGMNNWVLRAESQESYADCIKQMQELLDSFQAELDEEKQKLKLTV